MKATEIENMVFELEEVRIVIRATWNQELGDFKYDRKAANTTSVSEWLDQRIRPLLNGHDVVVINGSGELPHGRTRMDRLRQSYEH